MIFDLTNFTDEATTDTIMADGISLTFSNASPNPSVNIDSDGLCIAGGTFCRDLVSIQLSFDQDVQLISYLPGFVGTDAPNYLVTLTAGSSSSLETGFVDEQVTNFANQFTVAAGQIINIQTDFNGFPGNTSSLQWRELTVNEVQQPVTTPEPSSIVALLGFGALGFATRKKSK